MKKHISVFGIATAALTLLFGSSAHAGLGEVATVAQQSKEHPSKTLSAPASAGYTVHETRSEAHVIREYISPDGIVFGLSWKGLTHPDLSDLLGHYAGEFRQALARYSSKPGRRFAQVRSDGVVVEKWGHMRNLQGRAYVPVLLPQGVAIDAIR